MSVDIACCNCEHYELDGETAPCNECEEGSRFRRRGGIPEPEPCALKEPERRTVRGRVANVLRRLVEWLDK